MPSPYDPTLPLPPLSPLPPYSDTVPPLPHATVAHPQDSCAIKRPQDTASPLFFQYQPSTLTCYCANTYNLPQAQISGSFPCTGLTNAWALGRVSTTFTTFGAQCRTRAQVGLADTAYTGQGTPLGPYSCQNSCRSSRFAFWFPDVSIPCDIAWYWVLVMCGVHLHVRKGST